MPERPGTDFAAHPIVGIAGSGNIACGLAVACAPHLEVRLHARSEAAAERARRTLARMAKGAGDEVAARGAASEAGRARVAASEAGRVAASEAARVAVPDAAPGAAAAPERVAIVGRFADLAGATVLVEAVAEDLAIKAAVLRALAALPGSAPLLTTTSSLPLAEPARAAGAAGRVAALHLFSPVYRVPLAELAFPPEADAATRATVRALCDAIGKTTIEVPGVPGFLVNRVVFPMLLAAVDTLELTGLPPESIDEAMRLALGHPLGPLRTLDFIGLDVAVAIGERLDLRVPERLREMTASGTLGRKSGAGFFTYRRV